MVSTETLPFKLLMQLMTTFAALSQTNIDIMYVAYVVSVVLL